MQQLYKILNYTFQDPKLLEQALTHASKDTAHSYERLEFLGDAVLELVVSTMLYHKYPDHPEGKLTAARTQLVREEFLAAWARSVYLGAFLILGRGEENSGGREKDSILCDVTESIIGAIYLDGGLQQAAQLIRRIVTFCDQANLAAVDAKSELQELLQKQPDRQIAYEVSGSEGPPHNRTFYVNVLVDGTVAGSGSGKSKKQAEQAAARQALQRIYSK